MNCPNCHASIPDESRSCPNCGQPVIHVREVIDGELVDSPSVQQQYQEQDHSGGAYRHVVFTSSNMHNVMPSCQLGIVTLALAFVMGIQYGLLACIGFLVFTAIAHGVTFLLNLQMALAGRPLNPLLLQIISWFCCWSLVAWLAS